MRITPRYDEVRSQRAVWGTTSQPMLAIAYALKPQPAERMPTAQNAGATIAINSTGGTGGVCLITLTENKVDQNGVATTAVTTTIDCGVAPYTTLKGVLDKINGIGNANNQGTQYGLSTSNFKAWALNAPHSFAMNIATIATLATTAIPAQSGKP